MWLCCFAIPGGIYDNYIFQDREEENRCLYNKPPFPLQLFVGSVAGVSTLTFITGCGLGLLIGLIIMKFQQTKPQVPNINPSTQEEVETAPIAGPVYEEVQLRDLPDEINISQNVAYESASATFS